MTFRVFHRSGSRFAAAVSLAAAGLLACASGEPTTPAPILRDGDALFQTDSLQYSLQAGSLGHEAQLLVTYTNRTASATAFSNCLGAINVALQKHVDGQWRWAWSPVVPACLSPPIVVPPGGTYLLHISVFGGYPDCRCAPQFGTTDISGTYRAVWQSGFGIVAPNGGANSDSLPDRARVSNQFLLVAMPR